MSQLGYVFGTYFNRNNNLDDRRTSSRVRAKWRSQVAVRFDLGLQLLEVEGIWITLQNVEDGGDDNFSVPIVDLSDLDYQLRSTKEVEDRFKIEAHEGLIYTEWNKFIGNYVRITETYIPPTHAVNSTNPNPDPFQNLVYTPKPVIQPVVPFAETRLELGYDYGAVGGPSFSTEIVKVGDGRETKNSLSVLPLHRYQLGDRLVAESERDLLQEVSYLKQFHELRQGSYQGFRYKDWADYKSIHQLIGIGDGTTTEWQLRKGYWVGDVVTWRPITKPVVGTVVLWANGIEQQPAVEPGGEGWTVNHETGVISNPEPLADGVVLTALFEFDVPVRFESDALGFSLQAYEADSGDAIYRLESVFVKEIRLPLTLPWEIQPSAEITEELDLGIIYDTVEQYDYATERQELRSGWGVAKPNRDESKLVLNLGDRSYDRGEVDKLLAYFWNTRGKNAFPFKNLNIKYKVNFDQDSISLKFNADNKFDSLFDLSGLKIKIKERIILTVPVLPEFLVDITNFEISDFAVTDFSEEIFTNSYSSYGGSFGSGSSGGSSGSSSSNSSSSSSSGGFAGSFGSADSAIKNLQNGFTQKVQAINFIDYQPFLATYGRSSSSSSSRLRCYPAIAIPSSVDVGVVSFQCQDPFNPSDYNVASNSVSYAVSTGNTQYIYTGLLNLDDVLIAGSHDQTTKDFWLYAIKATGSGIVMQTQIEPTQISGSQLAVDSYVSYLAPERILFYEQNRKRNAFNKTTLFDKSVEVLSNFLYTVSPGDPDNYGELANLDIDSIIPKKVVLGNDYENGKTGRLVDYNQPFYAVKGRAIVKATSNTTLEVIYQYSSNLTVYFWGTDAATKDEYLIVKVYSNNPVAPHVLGGDNSESKAYYLVLSVKHNSGELLVLGSYAEQNLSMEFGMTFRQIRDSIFNIDKVVCSNGLLLSESGFLFDLINGGIINLKDNPGFFQGSLKISADKNGFGFYSSNKIGYLAINRA